MKTPERTPGACCLGYPILRFRSPFHLVMLAVIVAVTGCATKDPSVETLVGSEPQRLSFGAPAEVRLSFLAKMKACWFSGSNAPLAGFKYDTGEQPANNDDPGYYGILIRNSSSSSESFEVEFHKFNENTLVVTKNVSLPQPLFDRLKRDIQLWALTGSECGNS